MHRAIAAARSAAGLTPAELAAETRRPTSRRVAGRCLKVRGSIIDDFGGRSLEPPRRWLGARWLGLTKRVPSCPEPPGAR